MKFPLGLSAGEFGPSECCEPLAGEEDDEKDTWDLLVRPLCREVAEAVEGILLRGSTEVEDSGDALLRAFRIVAEAEELTRLPCIEPEETTRLPGKEAENDSGDSLTRILCGVVAEETTRLPD